MTQKNHVQKVVELRKLRSKRPSSRNVESPIVLGIGEKSWLVTVSFFQPDALVKREL